MTTPRVQDNRLPSMNFRGNKFVNEDGTLTDVAQSFFDLLNKCLIKIAGSEGLIAPQKSSTDINIIANNKQTSPTSQASYSYTCQFGTLLYDLSNNVLKVALNSGSSDSAPIFKTISTI